jgi:hypothetical protein
VTSTLRCSDAYVLTEGWRPDAIRVGPADPAALDPYAIATRSEPIEEPLGFIQTEGSLAHDLVGTTLAVVVLMSSRVIDLLSGHGFSGWSSVAAEVLLKDGSTRLDYSCLQVLGRSGPTEDELRERIIQRPKLRGGNSAPGFRGLCFDPASWDGSDVFTPEGYAGIFVLSHVVDALLAAAVTNVDFQLASEVERSWRARTPR